MIACIALVGSPNWVLISTKAPTVTTSAAAAATKAIVLGPADFPARSLS